VDANEAAVLPAAEQIIEFAVQVAQSGHLLLDLTGLGVDLLLQRRPGAHPRAPRFQDPANVLQRDLHRLEGADQGQL